jgi:hypothetical protein
MPKRKTHIRRRKQKGCGKSKSKSKKTSKGGCIGELGGCGLFQEGGAYKQSGGGWFDGLADQGPATFPASFTNVPIRSFYGLNNFSNDPNHLVVGGRNTAPFFTGGGKRDRKSRRRLQKGGFGFLNEMYSRYNPTPQSTIYSATNPPYE